MTSLSELLYVIGAAILLHRAVICEERARHWAGRSGWWREQEDSIFTEEWRREAQHNRRTRNLSMVIAVGLLLIAVIRA